MRINADLVQQPANHAGRLPPALLPMLDQFRRDTDQIREQSLTYRKPMTERSHGARAIRIWIWNFHFAHGQSRTVAGLHSIDNLFQ